MKTDVRSRISMHHVQHVYKQFQRNRDSVRLPIPVSVFCYRISDTAFGFLSRKDRDTAKREMFVFAASKDLHCTVTNYRDVNGPIAAQIILWHKDLQPGGISVHHGGRLKDHRTNTLRDMSTGKRI